MKEKTKKFGKRMAVMLFVIVMLLIQVLNVGAEEPVLQAFDGVVSCGDGDAKIVIEGNEEQSLVGKQFQLHRLFEAENSVDLESVDYTINPIYQAVLQRIVSAKLEKSADSVTEYEIIDYMQSLNSSLTEGAQISQSAEAKNGEYRYFVEELAEELKKEEITGSLIEVKGTKMGNFVELSGLSYGYYMVVDVSNTVGEHTAMSMPMLSTTNPTSVMRLKADYPTVTAKICEDEGAMWNDIGDFEMGQDIMFRYESTIPDINGYQSYYYTWHTEMDEALTLQEDKIEIYMTGTYNTKNKIYTLEPSEYSLIYNDADHSFVLEVQDIKAIVDREYGTDDLTGEGEYGQHVTVLYRATLNDKALFREGVPAFETDVRLEFSNNPTMSKEAEHGFTPWDTVVCYAYRLNGQKLNNYGIELEGAKFRLYRNPACTTEILVKKVGEQYVVMHNNSVTEENRLLATEIVSEEDGKFSIFGLDADTYYLKEVEAPVGYRLLTEPIELVLNADFEGNRNQYIKGDGEGNLLTLNATAIIKDFIDGKESVKDVILDVDQAEASVALAVVNQVGRKLPVTGTSAILLLTLGGISLIGVAMLRGKKKHE